VTWRAAALALAAVGAGLALAACGASPHADPDVARAHAVFTAAGGLGEVGLARLRRGMDGGALTLAARYDPAPHADGWDRPAAWATLDLAHVPTMPTSDVSQDDAALINAALPADLLFLDPAKPFYLRATGAERERAELCMTQAVYFEAGFEPLEGQQAVAQVIINRMRHPDFPKTVCGVVYQGSQTPIFCQFTFTCDGSLLRRPNTAAWAQSSRVAAAALNGFVSRDIGASTFYHADYVFPRWGLTMVKVVQLGAHIFYRFPGPAGEAQSLTGRYGGNELAVSITGPPLEAIEAARAALGRGVYASALAPMGPSLIPPPDMAAATITPVSTQAIAQSPAQLLTPAAASAEPLAPARPGQVVGGRRVPTPTEIARINARLQPAAATPAPPPSSADDGPIATAHAN
jgi:spore germination cell wall hydrolase CwlJ-like protein